LKFPCAYCDQLFKQSEVEEHQRRCRKRPRKSSLLIENRGRRGEEKQNKSAHGDVPGHLRPCAVCGRTFSADRIGKHQKICRKVKKSEKLRRRRKQTSQKKRDCTNQQNRASPLSKNQAWKRRSENLRAMVRRSKLVAKIEISGGKLNAYQLLNAGDDRGGGNMDANFDFVPCPTCKRTFSPAAFERHATICKNLRHARPKGLERFHHQSQQYRRPRRQQQRPSPSKGVGLYGPSTFGGWRQGSEGEIGATSGGILATNETSADNPMVPSRRYHSRADAR